MTMPNFLIIGAQKSGTTAMYHYLKQHPQIYVSPVTESVFAFVKNPPVLCGPGAESIQRRMVVQLDISNARELLKYEPQGAAFAIAKRNYPAIVLQWAKRVKRVLRSVVSRK